MTALKVERTRRPVIEQGTSPYLKKILDAGRANIWDHEEVLEYLTSRGVTRDQITELGLGYFPSDSWPPYVDPNTQDPGELLYLERSKKGYRLRGKLLFPLTNAMGYERGFQIRTPERGVKDYWKFYNVRSDVDAVFFGASSAMPHIWESREVVLVEGIFDLFPVRRVYPNAICVGTAQLNPAQVKFLLRHALHVKVLFDNDEFGDSFWYKFRREHSNDFQSLERLVYSGKDPSASWEALGEASFASQFDTFWK